MVTMNRKWVICLPIHLSSLCVAQIAYHGENIIHFILLKIAYQGENGNPLCVAQIAYRGGINLLSDKLIDVPQKFGTQWLFLNCCADFKCARKLHFLTFWAPPVSYNRNNSPKYYSAAFFMII